MNRFFNLLLITILAISVAACATKRRTGALTGAAAGAAVGSAVGDKETAAIGGLLGAIIGQEVGRRMDERDRLNTYQALEYNRTGETSDWVNPDTGAKYYVTPEDTFSYRGMEPCREFDIVTHTAGREYHSTEIACRRADGKWEIQS